MSNAAEICAQVRLKRDQLPSDIRAAQKQLQDELSKPTTTSATVKIPAELKLAPDAQAKLDAAVAKITVRPITVPVRFVPDGDPGGAAPPGSPSPRGGGGGGGGSPVSLRGLARFAGAGYLLGVGARAINAYDEYQGEMYRANLFNDPRASMAAEERLQNHIGSAGMPGMVAKVIADRIGGKAEIDKVMAQAELQDKGTEAKAQVNTMIEGLNRSAQTATMSAADRRKFEQGTARQDMRNQLGRIIKGLPANMRPDETALYAALDRAQGADDLHAYLHQNEQLHYLSNERDVRSARMSGDTDLAERAALESHQEERYNALRHQDPALAEKYKASVMPGETAELEDRQRRDRVKKAGDSAAHIADMEKASQEKIMHARGETYTASIEAAKRLTEYLAGELRRRAEHEQDAKKKSLLLAQAEAVERAGIAEQEATRIAHARSAETAARTSGAALGAATLAAGGHNRAARDSQIDSEYQEEVRQINESGINGPAKENALEAARNRRDAKKVQAGRDDAQSRLTMRIGTLDAEARAKGYGGVGEALDMLRGFNALEANTRTDKEAQEVRRYEKAKVAAFVEAHEKPKNIGHSGQFGGFADLDAHQNAAFRAVAMHKEYDAAMKIINNAMNRKGIPQAGITDETKQTDRNLNDAAKSLNDASNKIRNAKAIAVVG